MEKERSSKVIAICALLVGVFALSIGFAAFTRNLDIKSEASVNPGDLALDVEFTADNDDDPENDTDTVVATVEGATAGDATIDNVSDSTPVISGLKANFTAKGQSVIYTFYVHNASEYVAYLKKADFKKVTGKDSNIVCTAGVSTTASTVNATEEGKTAACDDISLTLSIAGEDAFSTTKESFSSPSINVDEYQQVVVTISYDGSNPLPDGDFSVQFGDISLSYSSLQ